jgi:hypothetical protein
MIDTIILAVIAVELAVLLWWARPEPGDVPARPERSENPAVPRPAEQVVSRNTDNDLRIESLIQLVDPEWKLGDPRDHVTLIPGSDGHIVEARLR